MQTKTIAKTIKKKLIEWLKTINDEELRQDVENNIIVSGGCITSMFMGEPVNDYDVYLKDINVAYRLAKYYTKSFDNITVLNGLKKAEYLELYSIYENEDTNYYTKSVITNLKPNQVKLLFENKEGGMKVNEKVKTEDLQLLYFRFYDPRVLRIFLPTCDRKQIVEFFGPVQAFICEQDEEGHFKRYTHNKGELIIEEIAKKK